ncbi:unnamed protein product [Prunus armeniaca]
MSLEILRTQSNASHVEALGIMLTDCANNQKRYSKGKDKAMKVSWSESDVSQEDTSSYEEYNDQ